MYHFTGNLYLPLVSFLYRGKIHQYLQVLFQLLTMQHDGPWKTIIKSFHLFYLEAPNQAAFTQLLHGIRTVTKQEPQKPPASGREG